MIRSRRLFGAESPGRALIILAAVMIVAWTAANHAIGNIAADLNPDLALRSVPDHPVALADKATSLLDGGHLEEARRLAQESVRNTAVSSDGFRVLSLVAAVNTDGDEAAPLFEYALRFSRREVPVQIWLFQHDLLEGQIESALQHIDAAMRVSRQSRSVLYPLLAGSLSDDRLVAPVTAMFGAEPDWAPGFIVYAIRNGASLDNLARVIGNMPDDSVARSTQFETMLLNRLAETGNYAAARAFMDEVSPGEAAGLVRDASFANRGPYQPFDWIYAGKADLSASPISAESGGLEYSAGTGQGGRVARQLITLDPGSYSLRSTEPGDPLDSDGGAYWTVSCATGTDALARLVVGAEAGTRSNGVVFTVPTATCPAQWLDLNVRATFAPNGVKGRINSVHIASTPGGDVPPGS